MTVWDWAAKIFGTLLAAGFAALSVWMIALSVSVDAVIFGVGIAVLSGMIAGRLLFYCWIGPALEDGVFSILGNRTRLKTPPPLLSIPAGMIARGEWDGALQELLILEQQHPGEPALTLLLRDLYADHLEDPAAAMAAAERYFACPKRRQGEENVTLLMKYADAAPVDQALVLLKKEYGNRHFYLRSQRRRIAARIAVLQGGSDEFKN